MRSLRSLLVTYRLSVEVESLFCAYFGAAHLIWDAGYIGVSGAQNQYHFYSSFMATFANFQRKEVLVTMRAMLQEAEDLEDAGEWDRSSDMLRLLYQMRSDLNLSDKIEIVFAEGGWILATSPGEWPDATLVEWERSKTLVRTPVGLMEYSVAKEAGLMECVEVVDLTVE